MLDIVICSLPQMSVGKIPAAPALLKSAVTSAGYSANGLDLSINFFNKQCNRNVSKYNELCSVFRGTETPNADAFSAADDWVKDSILILKQLNPKIVGLSVFSHWQHRASYMLAVAIRNEMPDVKIIVGGYGLTNTCISLLNFLDIKKIHTLKTFHQYMTEHNLCDYVIIDDPLNKLILTIEEILGVPKQIEFQENKNQFDAPIPNYDDYQLDNYVHDDIGLAVPITGSKGCVRKCTFCDVPHLYGRFKSRTGRDIANELIFLHETYSVQIFEFTDSLVNGSNKAFLEWVEIIADYNDKNPNNKIRWSGQYICKPQSAQPKGLYPLLVRSGASHLIIGVESGSDDVLKAMKKRMTVKDVYDELEMFRKYGLRATILMLSGFINETWERYLETLRFIISCQPYVVDSTVTSINMSFPLLIYDGVELSSAADQLGILIDPYELANWKVIDDPDNDFTERCRRRVITQLILDKLGINMGAPNLDFYDMTLNRLKQYEITLQEQLDAR